MRRYAHSDDLEPGSQHGGAAAQLAGCAGMRVATHKTQPHHTSPKVPATAHPHQHLGSAPNSVEISSIGGTTKSQQISAQRHPDPPQSHQNCLRQFGHSSNPPSFHRPRVLSNSSELLKTRQEHRARLARCVPGESGHSGSAFPLNITQNTLARLGAFTVHAGTSNSGQGKPSTGLSASTSTLQLRTMLNVKRRVTRPGSSVRGGM